MKTRIAILTITALTLIAFPFAASAQSGPGDCDGSGPHGPAMMGGPGGPGEAGGPEGHGLLRMLSRIGERIGLTEAQQTEVQAIIDARQPELENLHEQAAASREAFRASHEFGDWNEAAFREHFTSQAQLHVEMKLIGAEMASQVWDVLTSEQQQQLLDIIELIGPGHGPGKGGGKRFGGGRRGPQ
jgi:Spy/CpxP family protein refolding chaperone